MRPLASRARMEAAESAAEQDWGIPSRILMENAAAAVERALPVGAGKGLNILVISGRGNNGGDGLAVAARLAQRGRRNLAVVATKGSRSVECSFRLSLAEKAGVSVLFWPDDAPAVEAAFRSADIVLDALCGTGLSTPLRETEASIAAQHAACRALKIALDVPSGFRESMAEGEPVLRADETLAIGMDKTILHAPAFRELAGEIRVVGEDVFPKALVDPEPGDPLLLGTQDLRGSARAEKRDAHKGSRGKVAVFAGSEGMSGAAYLAASAAGRAGAGYVRLVTDRAVLPAVARRTGGVIAEGLPLQAGEAARHAFTRARASDALVIGPGWGIGDDRSGLLDALFSAGKPAVVDADALRLLGSRVLAPRSVITPHPGEAAFLLGEDVSAVLRNASDRALALARRHGAVAVLKGSVTWIASPSGSLACVDGRTGELGTAGSGDVLAGILGALLARGMDSFAAAEAGVLIHLEAGRRAIAARGNILAEDVLLEVSRASKDAESRS